jgi:charged multivesicular body protein 7
MTRLLDFVLDQREHFRRVRLPSLYSDFSLLRYTNPDGFDANVYAWQDVLQRAAWAGLLPPDMPGTDILSLTVSEKLLSSLETNEWGKPQALGTVVEEAVLKRLLVPELEFQSSSTSIYDRSWLPQPWALLSWGFRRLGLLRFTSSTTVKLESGRFVIISNVEKAASSILSHAGHGCNPVNRVFSLDAFRKEASAAIGLKHDLTLPDLKTLLIYLARDKRSIIFDEEVRV